MIANLRSLLGKIGTVLDAEILVELKLAQTQVERGPILPWFLIKEKYAKLTVDEPRVAIPTDFLREAEESALYAISTAGTWTPLDKDHLDNLRKEYEGQTSAIPEKYMLLGGYFWCYPIPDSTYTVRMNYYAADTALATGDSGNLWSTYYPDLLMGLAGQNLAIHFRALDIKTRFDEMVLVARQQMLQDETGRELANFEGLMGGG